MTKPKTRQREPKHGTYYEYSKHGCRCGLCKKASSKYVKEKMAKNPQYKANSLKAVKRYQRRVREYVRERKEASPCEDCGLFYPYYVMHYDHLDPTTKKGSVSQMSGMNSTIAEIAKCELVCANCHAERTNERGYDPHHIKQGFNPALLSGLQSA